jgi:hypothetical protein
MKRLALVALLAVMTTCSACSNSSLLEPVQDDYKHKPHIQPWDRPEILFPQDAAESAMRNGLSFCQAHSEVPACRGK